MRLIQLIFICLIFSSCINQRKVSDWNDKHLSEAAQYCSVKFPVQERIDTLVYYRDSSEYKKAYENIVGILDSVLHMPVDTIYKIDTIKKIIQKRLPSILKPCINPPLIINRYIIDSAKIKVYMDEIKEKTDEVSALNIENKNIKESRNRWMKYFFILAIIVASIIAFKIINK